MLLLSVGIGVTMTHACTDAREPTDVAQPEPERSEPPVDEPAKPVIDPLEPLALLCDGAAIKSAFVSRELAALASDETAGPSVRLLATWEHAREFKPDGTLDPAAVEALREALTAELGREPPQWWIEQLASAKQREADESGPPYYDVGITESGDRRGELIPGPGSTRVRPAVAGVVSASDDKLYFDLSMGRLELGPLPTDSDATLEISRARAGSTIYYASFSRGSGGFRFPLRAVAFNGGQQWEAEVCGPDRNMLGGLGYLTVEIVVLEPEVDAKPGEMRASSGATGIAVFTAESHGVALDVFDPSTGATTLTWSSDFWFAR